MNIAQQKLKEAKKEIKLLGLDFDGTVVDGIGYNMPEAADLFGKIISAGISVSFITARSATALKSIVPALQTKMIEVDTPPSCFIAGGNGTNLYEVGKNYLKQIYNYGLNFNEIITIVDSGRKIYNHFQIKHSGLAEKGLETFRKFLQDKWEGYIPKEIIKICRPYENAIFTEEAKVTFVLPKDKTIHPALISALNEILGSKYQVLAGDETYVHITKKLTADGKLTAVKQILDFLNLSEYQVATFGDMPEGNDAGLLSFPYSFTNSEEYAARKIGEKPPYILEGKNLTPVARIYETIEYLIS